MKNLYNDGARPYRLKWRDYDYLKTEHPLIFAGTLQPPQFPPEYLTDDGTWMPNQNEDGKPFACTSYTTVSLARILGVLDATVEKLEALTHANEQGGYGIIDAIDMARKALRWFTWRFVIQSTGQLSYFDVFRLAQVSGLPEKRAISWGTPWFPSWEFSAVQGVKMMPMPLESEFDAIKKDIRAFSWHNSMLDGWTTFQGKLVYRDKSWQGKYDYLYFPPEVINRVQALYGTVAVTATRMGTPTIGRVPLPDWFMSLFHSWFGWKY